MSKNSILENILPHIAVWWPNIQTIFYFVGSVLVIVATLESIDPNNRYNKIKPILTFCSGVLLLNLPSLMDTLSMTLFTSGSEQAISYSPPSHPGSIYVKFAIHATMLIGLIGVGRGCLLLKNSNNASNTQGKAILHLVGGTLAVNIVKFINAIGATAGGEVQTLLIILSVLVKNLGEFSMKLLSLDKKYNLKMKQDLFIFGLTTALLFFFSTDIAHAAVSFGEIGKNLGENFKDAAPAVKYGSMLAGAGFSASGVKNLYDANKAGGGGSVSNGSAIWKIVVGVLLLGLGAFVSSGSTTIFGSDQATGVNDLGL